MLKLNVLGYLVWFRFFVGLVFFFGGGGGCLVCFGFVGDFLVGFVL